MRIAIIGAGNIGGNLTRRLTSLGHEVRVANSREPSTLADLAAETGAVAVAARDAADGADLVVVTVPFKAVPHLPEGIVDSRNPGAPVVDTCNYYPRQRDGRIDAVEDGTPESVWVSEQIGAPVVKAFNGVFAAYLLSKPKAAGEPGRMALPVAGDDADEKGAVMELIEALGFSAVDAGPLAESWRQQPGTPVYGFEGDADQVRKKLAEASPDRPADFRAE